MKRGLAVAGIALALICIVFACLHFSEPRHKGRTARGWLTELRKRSPAERTEAELAIRALGTNAVPIILEQLRARESPSGSHLRRVAAKLHPIRDGRDLTFTVREGAVLAFRALGSLGVSAIPDLEELLNDPAVASDALRALATFSEEAQLPLVRATTNSSPAIRKDAVLQLGYRKVTDHGELDAIIATLSDPVPEVRSAAAYALVRFPNDSQRIVKALAGLVRDPDLHVRFQALQSLGDFGPKAKPVIPLLVETLGPLESQAVARIDPDLAAQHGIAVRKVESWE